MANPDFDRAKNKPQLKSGNAAEAKWQRR